MLRYETYYAGTVSTQYGEDTQRVNLYRNGDESVAVSCMEFFRDDQRVEFDMFIGAANDALDEIEAIVRYNEENNLYATKTYRDMVDILIRAGRR